MFVALTAVFEKPSRRGTRRGIRFEHLGSLTVRVPKVSGCERKRAYRPRDSILEVIIIVD